MITRRQLLASGLGTALLTLNDLTHGALDANALAAWPQLDDRFEAQEWSTGNLMWPGPYSCMPYMVTLPNGNLISTLTVNDGGEEGATSQRTIILRSTDGAASWVKVAEMEPALAPESSWGMPWLNNVTGRLYVFYTYNDGDLRTVPAGNGSAGTNRVDMLGVVAYRSSMDGGLTWTTRRHLNLPATAIDMRNPFAGTRQLQWLTGHPVQYGNAAYLGMSKWGVIGETMPTWMNDTEAFIVKVWETSPGVLASKLSAPIMAPPVAEEPSPVVFSDGVINVTFRTNAGLLGEAVSTDDGVSWNVGWARDRSGDIVPQPRGKAPQLLLPDGRLLMFGYSNNVAPPESFPGGPRHPVYYRLGDRVAGGRVVWGAPRLMIYDKAMTAHIGYPSMVVSGDALLVATSEKIVARVFRFPLAGL